jgi:RNA polymerase sigma-70 factor (ECF subfamily)
MAMNKDGKSASEEVDGEGPDRQQVLQWITQAQAGDEEAFGSLVRMYHDRVYGVVYRFVHNADDAGDLSQQTWIKVWKKLDTFQGKSEFFTWVYRIASFVSLDYLRKRKRQRETALADGWEPDADVGAESASSRPVRPDRALEHVEVRDRFERVLEMLTPEHRMALTLREVEGLSYEEIAGVMKCRKGTVMSRLYYARKCMQEQMKDLL